MNIDHSAMCLQAGIENFQLNGIRVENSQKGRYNKRLDYSTVEDEEEDDSFITGEHFCIRTSTRTIRT